jgi:hypothetical protein
VARRRNYWRGQESAAKAGKAGAKVKRLKPLIDIDEEEDFEDSELDPEALYKSVFPLHVRQNKSGPFWAICTYYSYLSSYC